ncbi:MAG: adenosylcobinamide-GDP ribazoletransferase [Mycobacteriales bacterium]
MTAGVRLALTTLTVLPVRGPDPPDRATAGAAMRLAPAVGLLLGGVAALLLGGVDRLTDGPPMLGPALAVTALALLTRGLHLDGLADLADGLGSYAGAERAREVMKQPDVGPFGVSAVVLVLLVQVGALSACVSAGRGPAALLLAVVTGRLTLVPACTEGVQAATTTGLGSLVAGTVRRGWTTALVPLVAAGGVAALTTASAVPVLLAPIAVLAGMTAARLLRQHAIRRLGGITGDVLGALVEVATTVALIALAVQP